MSTATDGRWSTPYWAPAGRQILGLDLNCGETLCTRACRQTTAQRHVMCCTLSTITLRAYYPRAIGISTNPQTQSAGNRLIAQKRGALVRDGLSIRVLPQAPAHVCKASHFWGAGELRRAVIRLS